GGPPRTADDDAAHAPYGRERRRASTKPPTRSPSEGEPSVAVTPLLETRGIDKSFGPVQVLHDVGLSVYPGEVTALVGDNGAGKSSLVNSVGVIYTIDAGTVTFDGNQIAVHSP